MFQNITADHLDALASIGTLAIALLVFFEARSMRTADGIFRQNEAWNSFGNTVARLQKGNRIGDMLMGKDDPNAPGADDSSPNLSSREAFLLMSFFNVVSSEYNAYRARTIDEQYVLHSFTMTSTFVRKNRAWIFGFLKDYGYEESFRRVIAVIVLASDDLTDRKKAILTELCRHSKWGRLRRILFRRRYTDEIDETLVQALCRGERIDAGTGAGTTPAN